MGPPVNKRRRKRGNNEAEANALPKVLRRDHDAFRPAQSTHGGKSLASMGLHVGSLLSTPAAQDPSTAMKKCERSRTAILCEAATAPRARHCPIFQGNGYRDPHRRCCYRGDACQDIVDHIVPARYFSELRHLPNADFISQYNINLARQVAMGSQLRLRFEQEVGLLKKARSKIARRDQRIQVLNLQAQVTGEEKIKAAFEEFKKYEDDKVEQRCAEMDSRLDKLSVDFDEELYPHMLTVITGRRWVIGHGLRLAVMKCAESSKIRQAFVDVVSAGLAKGMSEGLKYGIEHGKAGQDLADVEAYDSEATSKLFKALQDLKDLKYPMVGQLERLKDVPMELLMASLHLESDTGEDASQWIRHLRPSFSQLKIPVYPEVCDPEDPWAAKEEVLLEDVIAANISRAEKKKKCRVVCRTHGIGSAHHARSDGIPVFAPTVPQGLAILLANAATQTEAADKEEEPHPRVQRSISLPRVYDL
ncbi:hypothetical protein Tco_1128557 [Tanacetum coccineum]